MMKGKKLIMLFILFSVVLDLDAQEKRIKTAIESATVFTFGAQVSRTAIAKLDKGENRIIFSNLPPAIDEQSVQLSVGKATLVAVSFQKNVLDSIKSSPELEKLQLRGRELERRIRLEKALQQTIATEKEVLLANRELTGAQGIKMEDLKATLAYFRVKLEEYDRTSIEKEEVITSLSEELNKIRRQIQEFSKLGKTETSELVVTLISEAAISEKAEIKYFTRNAGWFPSYDIRVENIIEPLTINYKANIQQFTGEDWKGVKLTVSSGDPSVSSTAPQLTPWMLDYTTLRGNLFQPGGASPFAPSSVRGMVSGRVTSTEDGGPLPGVTVIVLGTTVGTVTDMDGFYRISLPPNAAALSFSFIGMETQVIPISSNSMNLALRPDWVQLEEVVVSSYGEKTGRASFPRKEKPTPMPVTRVDYKTSFSFQVDLPYDIPSTGRTVVVTLNTIDIKAEYRYYTVPKLVPNAFLEARITGWEQHNLLDGEANLYFEEKYIGKSALYVSGAADTLNLSLGKDEAIAIKRTKPQQFKEKNLIGTKRTEKREFEIAIRNNKSEEVTLSVNDQIPVSINEEIRVKEIASGGGKLNPEKGYLVWVLTVAPGETKKLKFGYSVEYPSSKSLVIE